jgi:hypothetical protein
MMKDGRTATQPYRVRVGTIWYWVDPTARDLAPGDTVIVYPVAGDVTLAILQSPLPKAGVPGPVGFSSLEGDRFTIAAGDIAVLHLAAVDDQQS